MTLPNLQDIKGIGTKRHEKIVAYMQEKKLSLADIYAMPVAELRDKLALPLAVATAIVDAAKDNPDEKKNILENNSSTKEILLLSKEDERYPQRLVKLLGTKAPAMLSVWGNLDLFNKVAVGFCGSRNVTEKGLEVTADVSEQIAKLGWVIVSGHARGVDMTAHRVALENNAGTIIVLPQGFKGFKLNPELKKLAKKEQLLIISEFPEDAGWQVWRAMQRNSTIIALSSAMVLVESRTEGGTYNAGKTALHYKQPLFVVEFQEKGNSNEGNEYFLKHGAIRLAKSRETGRANINQLREKVESNLQSAEALEKPKQMQLFE